ncbi:MAG: AAA family ATPase [Bacteroidota bacterium]
MSEALKILILTGAPGVGKTTVSKVWVMAHKGVAVPGDSFTDWLYNSRIERFSTEEEALVANLAVATAVQYLKTGMGVVLDYVWRANGLEIIKNRLEAELSSVQQKFVHLICGLEENHRRDQLRISDHQMLNRVDMVNLELSQEKWPQHVEEIDSTSLSVSETVAQIENTFSTK